MLLTPAQIKPKSFESRQNFFSFFFTRGGCASCSRACLGVCVYTHTPSIAFRHLPPNSARFSYAIDGALFISVQLSSDTVSAL